MLFRYGNRDVQEVFISILGKKIGGNLRVDMVACGRLKQACIYTYNGV